MSLMRKIGSLTLFSFHSLLGGLMLVVCLGIASSWIVLVHDDRPPEPVFVTLQEFGEQVSRPLTAPFRPYLPEDGLVTSPNGNKVYFDWAALLLFLMTGLVHQTISEFRRSLCSV